MAATGIYFDQVCNKYALSYAKTWLHFAKYVFKNIQKLYQNYSPISASQERS